MIKLETKQQIKELALKTDLEICGLILDGERVFPCKNISPSPKQHFKLNPEDYLEAVTAGKIEIIYHSHSSLFDFSEMDKQNLHNHKLRGVVYCKREDKFNYFFPESYNNRYVGQKWEIGVSDCLSLVRDYYKNELEINLPDFKRGDKWYDENPNLINESIPPTLKKIEINDLQKHDILVFDSFQNNMPFHLGIYLGSDVYLHNSRNKTSRIDYLNEFVKKKLSYGLRWT